MSVMVSPQSIAYSHLLEVIEKDDGPWSVLAPINYEDCSVVLLRGMLGLLAQRPTLDLRLFPFRLFSRRTSPWSALELVKDSFQCQLQDFARESSLQLQVLNVEYPPSESTARDLLGVASGSDQRRRALILDLSAVPRELAAFFCDALLTGGGNPWMPVFREVFLVHTLPERFTSRQGLGPFSVGGIRCLYNPDLIRRPLEPPKTSLLVFPGYEGFEAKAAIDAVSAHETMITVAIGLYEHSLIEAFNVLIGNQIVLADAAEGRIEQSYYFSEVDGYRVAMEAVGRALNWVTEKPYGLHAFVVAPFGPKPPVALGCLARRAFETECRQKFKDVHVITDIMLLSTYQYVSLYSRGALTPHVMRLRQTEDK